ncbi:tripartite tricarboxylate transporter TctB family protein [Maritalea mobilis]|uniref:tripartite tricarboxylate transporter TctB family protein n=1 Tax=Maritalea mobilis TaxID=483324 RepID=UPI001C98C956|nr:tripartite tricarboxylate transporter TctB family protein [Maritalea mobilis]MBY6201735.1 tripartite tricarboxylate transporter TctB family protein [Maritalea mobilis]
MSQDVPRTPSQEAGEIARLLSYVALLAVSAGLFLEARAMPTSRFEVLGAGAFPMLVHGCLSLLLVASIIASLRKIPVGAYAAFASATAQWVREKRLVVFLFVCLAVYVTSMPVIGYPVATLLFLLVLQITLAPKTRMAIATALILSLVFSFGLNWLFAEVFNVFLPRGR